ncbi:hypothetical protein [Ottowia sp.]|uniref:hypothetical protein n=1 Tax=Ottowia sp. TaxID=1898956 RepID=UPI0025F0C66D|nr:hypothetical protein [Ottowia sp.]MBK6616677.1 hypothetical protein [Ottowia sp.]
MNRAYNPDFYNEYRTRVGALEVDAPARKDGKKAFAWQFVAAGSKEAIPVEVMLVTGEDGLGFKATCARLKTGFLASDIRLLHKAVEEALMEQVASMSAIVWEDWYEVVVRGENSDFADSSYSALGGSLHIQVNQLKRGIHPATGKPMTINRNGVVVDFPSPSSLDVAGAGENAGSEKLRLGHPEERSYIPATVENRRALDELLRRMALLRSSMAMVLSQSNVQERLASLDVPLLLAAEREVRQ